MKIYIKGSTDRAFIVRYGGDAGGPETGPKWWVQEELIYAPSKAAAEAKVFQDYNSDLEDVEARLATQEEIDRYTRYDDDAVDVFPFSLW